MKPMNANAILATAPTVFPRAAAGAFPERMIVFTGPRSEGAIQDARA